MRHALTSLGCGLRRGLLVSAAMLVFGAMTAGGSLPLAGAQTAPSPPTTSPVTVTVTCDNGTTQQGTLTGPGSSLAVPNLPAGTTCTAQAIGPGGLPAVSSPPVPGGGTATVQVGRASASLAPVLGPPGRAPVVIGSNFPAGSVITLRWDVGFSPAQVTVADASGAFIASPLILVGEALGPRNLIVNTSGITPLSVPYLVVAQSMGRGDLADPTAFRR